MPSGSAQAAAAPAYFRCGSQRAVPLPTRSQVGEALSPQHEEIMPVEFPRLPGIVRAFFQNHQDRSETLTAQLLDPTSLIRICRRIAGLLVGLGSTQRVVCFTAVPDAPECFRRRTGSSAGFAQGIAERRLGTLHAAALQ